MLISHKKKFIYLKAHKVAGTSIELMLEPFCRDDNREPTHLSDEYVSESGIIGNRYKGKSTLGIWKNHTLPQTIKDNLSEETYEEMLKYLKEVDLTKVVEMEDNTNLTGEIACSGGACLIDIDKSEL
jgi:hypothetical protein